MSKPDDKEKIATYEGFLHDINLYLTCGDNGKIRKLVNNADGWSYAHRQGNGELSDEEQQNLIDSKFWKLREVNK